MGVVWLVAVVVGLTSVGVVADTNNYAEPNDACKALIDAVENDMFNLATATAALYGVSRCSNVVPSDCSLRSCSTDLTFNECMFANFSVDPVNCGKCNGIHQDTDHSVVTMFKDTPNSLQDVAITSFLDSEFKTTCPSFPCTYYSQGIGTPSGVYREYPGMPHRECDDVYPPDQTWYAGAASGPKDLVILWDSSNSMGYNHKLDLSKDLVVGMLNLISPYDWVNLVRFTNSITNVGGGYMMRGALDSVWQLSAKVCGNGAGGGSKFLKAFEKAFDILTASYTANHTSFCGATIVLVTDGDIKEDHPTLLDSISEMRNTYEQNCQPLSIFTYSFTVRGNDEDVLRKIACQNDGLWIRIEDQIDPWMISAFFDVYTFAREAATTTYTQASVWWNTPYDALYIDDDEATPASVAALPVYANSNGTYPAQLVAVVTYTVLLDQFLAADPNMTENIVTSDQYQLSPLYYYLMYHGDSAEKLCTNTKLSYDQLQYLRSKLATDVCSPGDFDLGSEAEHAIDPLPEEYWIPSEESLCPTNETSSAIVCDTPTFHPDEWGQELCCTDNPEGCPLEGHIPSRGVWQQYYVEQCTAPSVTVTMLLLFLGLLFGFTTLVF